MRRINVLCGQIESSPLEIIQMRNELYLPPRLGANGYGGKNFFWKDLLKDIVTMFLLAAVLIVAMLFVLIDPFEVFAPRPNDLHQVSGASVYRGSAMTSQSLTKKLNS